MSGTPVEVGLLPAQQSRTVLVTFLGSIVRQLGDWMPIAGTVELTAQLGLDEASVRTAVSRLKKRGWLISETRGGVRGYSLSAVALSELAAGDGVIWHARQPADLGDGWCLVTFSIPETARARRDRLRSHLSALGFGNVSAAAWIAPARMQAAAERAIGQLDLGGFCAVFAGHYVAGADLPSLVARCWDLTALDDRYQAFIRHFGSVEATFDDGSPTSPAAGFTTYLSLVDEWRRLPFRDPGLPPDVLPTGWHGAEALALFEQLVERLEPTALAHAVAHWTALPSRSVSSA